jgi:hypothetical protein
MNAFDYSATSQTRQHSAPIDIQMQHGVIQQQPPQIQIQQPAPQRQQMPQQMMATASMFDMPSTSSLHRPQSATTFQNVTNSSALSPPRSLIYDLHGNNDDLLFSPLMMDARTNEATSNQMPEMSRNQYALHRNPQSVDNLNINMYGEESSFGAGAITSQHLSIDAATGQQTMDRQRPMSLPPYENQQQMQQMFQQANQSNQQQQPPNNQWWG